MACLSRFVQTARLLLALYDMNIHNLARKLLRRKTPMQTAGEPAAKPPASPAPQGRQDAAKPNEKVEHIMVYGVERVGLTPPKEGIRKRNYHLHFEPFDSRKRFNKFDGVILFQGCFEDVGQQRQRYTWETRPHVTLRYDKNELDKRLNETKLLLGQGGYICVVLCCYFEGSREGRWKDTDLAKILLTYPSFYRHDLSTRTTAIRCVRDEFLRFLEIYGACWASFENLNEGIELKPIAMLGSQPAGMIMWDNLFFVPAMVPEDEEGRVSEFFTLLADAVVTTRRKLMFELPDWADKLLFPTEPSLREERAKAITRIEEIETKLDIYKGYKKALIQGDEQLVETVKRILEEGFRLKVHSMDEYREDLRIMSDDGTPLVFCEIKGVSGGIKREYVNQADSHRERAGMPHTVPAVLIVNTHIKGTRSLEEKDRDVPADQVVHAKKLNVLIMRTLDLLRLLRLLERGVLKENILDLFHSPGGWLRVSDGGWEFIEGQPNEVPGDSAPDSPAK